MSDITRDYKLTGIDLQMCAEGEGGDGNVNTDSGVLSGGDGSATGDNTQTGTEGNTGNASGDGLLSGDGQGKDDSQSGNDSGKMEGQGEDQTPQGAPEAYKDFTLPEGTQGIEFNPEAMTSFKDLAKGLNMSQENAQKLVDYQAKLMDSQQKQLIESHNQIAQSWRDETLKTYSKQDIADAVRGFKSAPQGVQQILAEYKLDNHPAFVGFFNSIGKVMKEDTFETGQAKTPEPKTAAEIIYPDLVQK